MQNTIITILLILFVLDAALLMLVVLLQDSKGQGLGGAFGGGGALSTSMFGGRGAADFLSKATTYLGTGFLVLSIVIVLAMRSRDSVVRSAIMETSTAGEQQIPQTGLPLLPGASPATPPPGGAGQTIPGTPDTSGSNTG